MSYRNLGQAVTFQLAWFACVLGGASGTSLWGAGALALLLAFAVAGGALARDLVLAGAAATLGFAIDTAWIYAGVLDYQGAVLAPAWIVMLWAGVGLSLHHSLSMFLQRPVLGGLLAGFAAPFSYLAGEGFGAVTIVWPPLLGLVSLVWLAVFAAGFVLARAATTYLQPLEE